VACLAQLGFAAKLPLFGSSRQRCEEAVALAEEHGRGTAWILAPALVSLACTMVWVGEFDNADHMLERADAALRTDSGPAITTMFHLVKGMLHVGRGEPAEAHEAFASALDLQSRLADRHAPTDTRRPTRADRHALTGYVTGWTLATRARLGATAEARTALEALDDALADSAELRTARATICLAERDPAGALAALEPVVDGGAPAIHVATLVEAELLRALALHELGDQRGVNRAVEHALALAEPERLILPLVMTGVGALLETFPRRESAHAALLTDVLDLVRGTSLPGAVEPRTAVQQLSPTELRVLRYLPTNLSRTEIARELSVSVNTVNTHVRNIYAKLQATGRSTAVRRARELRLLAHGPAAR
jgi:LuxR family maltose regulon positive regulatory protein